jgi:hypothetical protein
LKNLANSVSAIVNMVSGYTVPRAPNGAINGDDLNRLAALQIRARNLSDSLFSSINQCYLNSQTVSVNVPVIPVSAPPVIPVSAPSDMSQVAPQTYPAIVAAPQSPYVTPLQYTSYPAAPVAATPASGDGMTYVDTSSMQPTPSPVPNAAPASISNYLPWLIGGAILLLAATGKGARK